VEIKEEKMFEDCLSIFNMFEVVEHFISLAVDQQAHSLDPISRKFMIAAFGLGFAIGQGMQSEAMAQSIEDVQKNKDHLIFIYHLCELRRKLKGLGILKDPVS
jgi:hypothetical protein